MYVIFFIFIFYYENVHRIPFYRVNCTKQFKYLQVHKKMKSHCPFCYKELSRVEKLKYHISHSVCSKDVRERDEVLSFLNMDTSSSLDRFLQLLRKINEMSSLKDEIIVLKNENSILKHHNDTLSNIIIQKTNRNVEDNSTHIDDHSTRIDQSVHNDNTNISINLNLFGNENVDYIHVPNYLTDIFDVVKLVKDVHFNKNHPENHNVSIDDNHATIYRKLFLKNKILWEKYSLDEALSELIQNGETILSNYERPLTSPQEDVRNTITEIVEKETSWNCLTEKLSKFLHENKEKIACDFPSKSTTKETYLKT